jgi:hypothetical protein
MAPYLLVATAVAVELGVATLGAVVLARVRGFLDQAVVNDDGEAACTYLTARARVGFEGHGLEGPASCQSFFGTATLRLGGRAISSERLVDRLHYAVAPIGADRLVTVSSGGQEIRFRLRPADGYERQAFGAPVTPWRIASSVDALGAV